MSYSEFQDLLSACYLSRREIEDEFKLNPEKPHSYNLPFNDKDMNAYATNFLDELFRDENELDLEQISSRISEYKKDLTVKLNTWFTITNINVAIAKAASYSFGQYCDLMPEGPEFNLREILLKEGKPSPYGDSKVPKLCKNTEGGQPIEGPPADYVAVRDIYDNNMLALLIAREYEFEELDYRPLE